MNYFAILAKITLWSTSTTQTSHTTSHTTNHTAFWSFWVGVTDCCMTFRDQNPISTTSEHVQMLQRLRTCCMSLIDKSVKWRRVTANHTAIIQLLTISRFFIASFITCFRHLIISQTPDLVYRLVATRVCF